MDAIPISEQKNVEDPVRNQKRVDGIAEMRRAKVSGVRELYRAPESRTKLMERTLKGFESRPASKGNENRWQ
jgi:hypothetical protein